jgi:hypothetical protein
VLDRGPDLSRGRIGLHGRLGSDTVDHLEASRCRFIDAQDSAKASLLKRSQSKTTIRRLAEPVDGDVRQLAADHLRTQLLVRRRHTAHGQGLNLENVGRLSLELLHALDEIARRRAWGKSDLANADGHDAFTRS